VIPSLSGYGWSGKPDVTGWSVEKIAQAWIELMDQLGYERWVAQDKDELLDNVMVYWLNAAAASPARLYRSLCRRRRWSPRGSG
jgi:hypothetical protein